MLQRGDLVPHFSVATREGGRVRYSDLWQQKKLVLIALPPDDPDGDSARYVETVSAARDVFGEFGAEVVITGDALADVPRPGVVVADQWGEVYFVGTGGRATDLPDPGAIRDWLEHMTNECPECQGEAR